MGLYSRNETWCESNSTNVRRKKCYENNSIYTDPEDMEDTQSKRGTSTAGE